MCEYFHAYSSYCLSSTSGELDMIPFLLHEHNAKAVKRSAIVICKAETGIQATSSPLKDPTSCIKRQVAYHLIRE